MQRNFLIKIKLSATKSVARGRKLVTRSVFHNTWITITGLNFTECKISYWVKNLIKHIFREGK